MSLKNNGDPVYLVEQTSNNFEAIEPQTSSSNMQYVWNDTEYPNYKSNWGLEDLYGNKTLQGETRIFPHTVVTAQMNYTMIANLRKNCKIDQDYQTEFDGLKTDVVTNYIVEQNNGSITASNPYTPPGGSITYNYGGWADNLSAPNPRTITNPTDNTTYNAFYKYVNHSNNTNAYFSNSQKKLVRTADGYLHKVYESMGKVWYEKSTNNGTNWTIENNGKPLLENDAKLPAIDYNTGNEIIIVWQEIYNFYEVEMFKIRMAYYGRPGSQLVFNDVYNESASLTPNAYTFNTNPVIASGKQ